MTKSSIANEYNEINENGRNGWSDKYQINFFKEQGEKFAAAKKFPEAIESYTKAIEFYPSLCQLYSNRSGIYVKSGKYNEALQDANKAIEMHPMWPEGYFRKGSAFSSMGKYVDALLAFSDGLKHDPNNDTLLQGIKDVNKLVLSSSSSTSSKQNKDENLLKSPKQERKSKRISLDAYRKRTMKKQDDSENDKNDTPDFEVMEGHQRAMDVQSNPHNPKAVQKKTEVLSPKRRIKETLKEKVMLKVECPQNSESEIPSLQQVLINMKNSLEAVVANNALIRKEYIAFALNAENGLKEVKEELKEVKEELKEAKEENKVLANELKKLKDDNIVINNAVMLLKEDSQMLSRRFDNFLQMQR